MPKTRFHKMFKRLFATNIRLKGLRAAVFALGLSASRYIEYAVTLDLSKPYLRRGLVVEVGCGHSLLPSIWAEMRLRVVAVDINVEALRWQVTSPKLASLDTGSLVQAIQASAEQLPFRNGSVSSIVVMSVIEHIPHDSEATSEIGRVLMPHGLTMISIPLSGSDTTFLKSGYETGIPSIYQRLFGSSLLRMLKLFNVDRGSSHIERFYGAQDVRTRLIKPSGCTVENQITLRSRLLVRIVHERLIPTGVLSLLEFLVARYLMIIGDSTADMDAIIYAARKMGGKRTRNEQNH
nr:methyltransferase domain-containing protein [Candidatus Njordarchaeum guaymaensis]